VVSELRGNDLVGMQYEPVFDTYKDAELKNKENAWKVYAADFVTDTDGSGIVHVAPGFGDDDLRLTQTNDIPFVQHVSMDGTMREEMGEFAGLQAKPKDAHQSTDVEVIKYLAKASALFSKEKIIHSYPHCWRCDTPLLNYATTSWFVKVTDMKDRLVEENKKVRWVPETIGENRFGKWLEGARDWNVSRSRFWGAPIPVWKSADGKITECIGSIAELKSKIKRNDYFVMRHGEAENNAKNIYSSDRNKNHLTELGRTQVLETVQELKKTKITKIYCSPFLRTRETAEIVAEQINFPKDKIIYDDRIRELEFGDFSERPVVEYWDYMEGKTWAFDKKIPGGESFQDGKNRIGDFLHEIDGKNKEEAILIISHGLAVGLVPAVIEAADKERSLEIFHKLIKNKTGSLHREHEFIHLPHNQNYELDLHKPYIDTIKLICECGGEFVRTKEVMDVWFDSGAMPFAQHHYPFQNKQFVDGPGYPADYISEAIDQTRGWFYTLHAVGVLMGRGRAYKNVICLGHLLDANGKKMSKSIGNVVDPWAMIDKYGVDTLRMWMYSVNQPGESKNFDEKTVALLHQQVFTLLYNVLAFYEIYRDREVENNDRPNSQKVLDKWILSRIDELNILTTENLDNYKLLEPVRAIRDFVGDLSTWYLRRSRERIKDGDKDAKQTLYFVLKTLAKIIAPFAPFAAEDIWLKLKVQYTNPESKNFLAKLFSKKSDSESVHLEEWPTLDKVQPEIVEKMKLIREIASLGLEARQKAKIPVKQALNKLKVKSLNLKEEFLDLIKEELNVKEVVEDKNISEDVELDIEITPALKAEGEYREFIRELQERRKKLGLNPGDKMSISISDTYKKYKIPSNLQEHMLRVAAVASMICDNFSETLPKEEIVTACLLHDMGNIVKFKMNVFPEVFETEGLEYWQKVKDEYTNKYGTNDHIASIEIAKELRVSERILKLVDAPSFIGAPHNASGDDFGMKIVDYSDVRVYPFGVVSIEERFLDLKKRYVQHVADTPERIAFENALREIEKQIFAKCKIKPEDITNESIAPILEELRGFVIK